mgnify:CR=1 FL=1
MNAAVRDAFAPDGQHPAETSGTAAPSETEEVQYSPGKITRIYVYTTDRMLDTFVERYGEEHWDFDYRVLATTDQTTLYADDVFRLVKDNLINNTERSVLCSCRVCASVHSWGIIPVCMHL